MVKVRPSAASSVARPPSALPPVLPVPVPFAPNALAPAVRLPLTTTPPAPEPVVWSSITPPVASPETVGPCPPKAFVTRRTSWKSSVPPDVASTVINPPLPLPAAPIKPFPPLPVDVACVTRPTAMFEEGPDARIVAEPPKPSPPSTVQVTHPLPSLPKPDTSSSKLPCTWTEEPVGPNARTSAAPPAPTPPPGPAPDGRPPMPLAVRLALPLMAIVPPLVAAIVVRPPVPLPLGAAVSNGGPPLPMEVSVTSPSA
ncbi:hypothetical protein NOLU111490_01160 [Novosphingobium lubricantis]